jgi:signal transduction histidine kinase
VTFVYNDAANELRLRKARIDDLDAALRRLVQSTEQEIAEPLRQLERTLAESAGAAAAAGFEQAHELSARVENLLAAAKLRMAGAPAALDEIDLNALVERVVARERPGISVALPAAPVRIHGDRGLVERAVANLVDNAVRYSAPDGIVTVALTREPEGRAFRLSIRDTGPGLSAEEFKTLTAIRRFRGDEHRNRRPGAPGLGLAVAREVADRFGFRLDLRQPESGGFEAEFSGPVRG